MSNPNILRTPNRSKPLALNRTVIRFHKDRLPPARSFYELELGKLSRPNRKGWAMGRCPFHTSQSGKSFSVNLDTGGFHCFGCDAKGGDVISFLRLRDGLSFKEACQQLGCWEEDGPPVKVRRGPSVRSLVIDFTIDGNEYHAEVCDEAKTELQLDRRFYAEAADRLSDIRNGDAERLEGEEEVQWEILATSWELITMESADGK